MFEAVPNVSEGRASATVDAVCNAISSTERIHLLHRTSDIDHNRSVITYVSESAEAISEATLKMYDAALSRIDLRKHRGEHPRAGAVDVVPFVPLAGTEMKECVALAERVGAGVASRFGLPVYLYEYAARHDYRRELPSIRSGGFENFPQKVRDPRWAPDFGPSVVHPTAGVTVIGARVPLVAFNVQLASDRFEIAQKIARKVRASSGGLPFVRALPIHLTHRGIVQVSMNLLDYRVTPILRVFEAVRDEAHANGVEVLSSEIVGLLPADALQGVDVKVLQLENFSPDIILERRIGAAVGKS